MKSGKFVCLVVCAVVCLIAALTWATLAPAQTFERGEIRGTVYDQQHAAVPKAKVTLSNASTGYKRETKTDDNGGYLFAQISPGTYTLVAEAENFAPITVKDIEVNIGASLNLDVTLPVKGQAQTVEVTAAGGTVDTTTAGINQVINQRNVENLPLLTQDYRDLAQLSSTAQVVPGLRGGIRLGGQQSDYSNLVIDGTNNYDNFFGEFFGSLETKNFTIPIDAVQEFQVVTNGFAPEFGRATGGLINVVTKSGTNDWHGTFHYFYRGSSLTANDAFGVSSNISNRNEVGGTLGFPIHKDRQFLFGAFDVQRQNGPLATQFCPPGSGQAACVTNLGTVTGPLIHANPDMSTNVLPAACKTGAGTSALSSCYGVSNLAGFLGSSTQFQNLATVLGRYDYQITPNHHFSTRIYSTQNHTNGFTGGRGQNEISAAFNNTENFKNDGVNGVAALNSVFGPHKVNEIRFLFSGETRPRHANGNAPEVQFNGGPISGAIFGQRFFLPINGDSGKVQALDNFEYSFGRHDIKFGGDMDVYDLRKDMFAGWSKGNYQFADLTSFINNTPTLFFQNFGQNGQDLFKAGTLFPNFQTAIGLYWQDKWQITPRFTLSYGLRWDATLNPQPQSPTPGAKVLSGQGSGSKMISPPQRIPNDFTQWGPRIGAAYQFGPSNHITIVRGAWGLYYAQTPSIFLPIGGGGKTSLQVCFIPANATCAPSGGYPYLFPSNHLPPAGLPSPTIVDPAFRNPRVSNLTAGVEHQIMRDLTVSVTYAYVHSLRLRTGGFSSTVWSRNWVCSGTDSLGRCVISGNLDPTLGTPNSLGSFGRGNYNELAANITKRFSRHFQFFGNYTWSQNRDNASSERDTDSFFGPQDPFNLNLDYGRNGLDVTHQFKGAGVYDLPWGVTISGILIAHSGVPFPAYDRVDHNHDGVSNQGFNNDRPTVTVGSSSFLLSRYPANQPDFFNWDFRLLKDFGFHERYHVQLISDFYNLTNRGNIYSNPNAHAFVDDLLTSIPKPGDVNSVGGVYRKTDQIAPGSTPFQAQFGVKLIF